MNIKEKEFQAAIKLIEDAKAAGLIEESVDGVGWHDQYDSVLLGYSCKYRLKPQPREVWIKFTPGGPLWVRSSPLPEDTDYVLMREVVEGKEE